jgi:acyl-coenzyme A thioesterase PaaI-like protein
VSGHPAVDGREQELRRLAHEVRRLIEVVVTNTAPAAETDEVAEELGRLADRLAAHVPADIPPRYVLEGPRLGVAGERMPYDVVVGHYNPLALPLEMEIDPPRAVGRARFSTPYEGPPGCVHGAVIAGAFDMVCNEANRIAGMAGPTARLSIRYRRPTLLHQELTIEAEVAETRGKRTTTRGRIVQDGLVTAEVEGLFVSLDPEELLRMAEGRDRDPG